MGTTAKDNLPAQITFNPYLNNTFVCKNLTTQEFPVRSALCVILNNKGVSGAYLG